MNNQSLQVFDFKEQPVRILGTADEPLFVTADVCRVLEIVNSSHAVSRLDEDEKGVATNDTLGGKQKMSVVSESGLYSLIFTSRKPQAKEFKRWVTHEVLPALRRTGRYEIPPAAPAIEEAPAALPEAEPVEDVSRVEWLSMLEVMRIAYILQGWPLARFIRLGNLCRSLAKSLGIEWKSRPDSSFGNIRIYPRSLIDFAMEQMNNPRLALTGGNEEMLSVILDLALHLDGSRELHLGHFFRVAKALGVCRDILGHSTTLDAATSVALGKRLQKFRGKDFQDKKGRTFTLTHRRTKRGAVYLFNFSATV